MLRLGEHALRTLADRLRERGAPASIAPPVAEAAEDAGVLEEFGPLCEIMYLVMVADGVVEQAERDAIRGALRHLDDRIRTKHFAEMLRLAEERHAEEGSDARVAAVARALAGDPVRGEVAYVLAAAVAWADDDVAISENVLLEDFAEAIGVNDAKSEDLLRILLL